MHGVSQGQDMTVHHDGAVVLALQSKSSTGYSSIHDSKVQLAETNGTEIGVDEMYIWLWELSLEQVQLLYNSYGWVQEYPIVKFDHEFWTWQFWLWMVCDWYWWTVLFAYTQSQLVILWANKHLNYSFHFVVVGIFKYYPACFHFHCTGHGLKKDQDSKYGSTFSKEPPLLWFTRDMMNLGHSGFIEETQRLFQQIPCLKNQLLIIHGLLTSAKYPKIFRTEKLPELSNTSWKTSRKYFFWLFLVMAGQASSLAFSNCERSRHRTSLQQIWDQATEGRPIWGQGSYRCAWSLRSQSGSDVHSFGVWVVGQR